MDELWVKYVSWAETKTTYMPAPFLDWLIPLQGFEAIPWCIALFLSFPLLLQMAFIQNLEGARITVWENGSLVNMVQKILFPAGMKPCRN